MNTYTSQVGGSAVAKSFGYFLKPDVKMITFYGEGGINKFNSAFSNGESDTQKTIYEDPYIHFFFIRYSTSTNIGNYGIRCKQQCRVAGNVQAGNQSYIFSGGPTTIQAGKCIQFTSTTSGSYRYLNIIGIDDYTIYAAYNNMIYFISGQDSLAIIKIKYL